MPPAGNLAQLGCQPGFEPLAPLAHRRVGATLLIRALLSLALPALLLLAQLLEAEGVPGVPFPVPPHGAARLPLVQAVPELTGGLRQPPAHFGKQRGQLAWICR